jgi:hypothetical protein
MDKAYTILVREAGASERGREDFLFHCGDLEGFRSFREYRFGGSLGHGGKFRIEEYHKPPFFVTAYSEDETKKVKAMIEKTNAALSALFDEHRHVFVSPPV